RTAGREVMAARMRLFEDWTRDHPEARPQRGLLDLPLQLHGTRDLPFLAPHAVNVLVSRDNPRSPREIRSTLDLNLQRTLERQVHGYVENNRRLGIENAAALLIDTRTMDVKAVIGSANFFNNAISGQVNGTIAKRSPGSTLKPFIYALAIDQGLIH